MAPSALSWLLYTSPRTPLEPLVMYPETMPSVLWSMRLTKDFLPRRLKKHDLTVIKEWNARNSGVPLFFLYKNKTYTYLHPLRCKKVEMKNKEKVLK